MATKPPTSCYLILKKHGFRFRSSQSNQSRMISIDSRCLIVPMSSMFVRKPGADLAWYLSFTPLAIWHMAAMEKSSFCANHLPVSRQFPIATTLLNCQRAYMIEICSIGGTKRIIYIILRPRAWMCDFRKSVLTRNHEQMMVIPQYKI